MVNQQKLRIIFTEKADIVLLEILKNYGLEENSEKVLKKLTENKEPHKVIIDKLTKEFVQEEISEKDLITVLQKDLGVSQQIAKKISEDIKNNLVPLLEKIPETEFVKLAIEKEPMPIREEMIGSETELPLSPKKPLEIPSEEIIRENIERLKSTEQVLKTEKPAAKTPFEKEKPKPSQKSSDAYREPIE